MNKTRLDQLLVDRSLAPSKTEAQRLVENGLVTDAAGRIFDKPGHKIADDTELVVSGAVHPFVSRGGMKLQAALDQFAIDVTGLVAIDVGASTGGFTDCLLQRGAAKIFAVDVGHDQLAPSLRADPRVVVMEQTNARTLTADQITQLADLVVCDASFISLKLVLPAALSLTKPSAQLIALIKPQFEVGRERIGKNGVVSDPKMHKWARDEIAHWLTGEGWTVRGIADSPITGPAGNREFLIYAVKSIAPNIAK